MSNKLVNVSCYPPLTKCYVPAISSPGLIESVKIDYGNTILYQVDYWLCGEQKSEMLHPWEIEVEE